MALISIGVSYITTNLAAGSNLKSLLYNFFESGHLSPLLKSYQVYIKVSAGSVNSSETIIS